MKSTIWDLIKAGELGARDTLRNKTISFKDQETTLFLAVFELHHTDKSTFYKSYDYYLQNPKWNKILMDSVNALAMRDRNSLYTYHPPIRISSKPRPVTPLKKPLHEKQIIPKR